MDPRLPTVHAEPAPLSVEYAGKRVPVQPWPLGPKMKRYLVRLMQLGLRTRDQIERWMRWRDTYTTRGFLKTWAFGAAYGMTAKVMAAHTGHIADAAIKQFEDAFPEVRRWAATGRMSCSDPSPQWTHGPYQRGR